MSARSIATTSARLGVLALGCLLHGPVHVFAQAGLLVPTSTGRPDASVLALREMTIDVGIARGYARVNVRQVFENKTGTVQEGTYRFRLPRSASMLTRSPVRMRWVASATSTTHGMPNSRATVPAWDR